MNKGDVKFLQRTIGKFGVHRLLIEESSSVRKHPDIWIVTGKIPVITITQEWKSQKMSERRKRLVHELIHASGEKRHGWRKGRLLYSTFPEKDTYSRMIYKRLARR